MNFVCIRCPVSCMLAVEKKEDQIIVSGNKCVRGKDYGIQEVTAPTRMVTTTVSAILNNEKFRVAVKTQNPVPKDLVFKVLDEIERKGTQNIQGLKVSDALFSVEHATGKNVNIIITGIFSEEN